MKNLTIILALAILYGCAQNGYKNFYTSIADVNTLPDVERLSEGQKPEVLTTDNIERDILILRSKGYIPLGISSFNGSFEETKSAVTQAISVGATIVLLDSKYTDTQTRTSTLLLPNIKTTQHSGSFYGNHSNNGYIGNGSFNGTYRGTSTTYDTQQVPITYNQRRYDQTAIFFIKSNQKYKVGILFDDLTPEERIQFERNTGALIMVVIEGTPAFNSNLLMGDLLIGIDGVSIINSEHASEIIKNYPTTQKRTLLKIIRDKKVIDIIVEI